MPVLRGEIELDGKKALLTLRQTQSEVTKTSSAFSHASRHSERFAQSMLSVQGGSSAAHKALHFLGKAGFAGFGFAAAYRLAEQFAEALNKTGEEAQKSGKLIDSSFRAGRAATSVEGITTEIEKLTEEQKRLEEEAGKFDLQRMFAKGLKSLTGIDLGADILETNAENARLRIENLKKLLDARKKEEDQIRVTKKRIFELSQDEQRAGITKRRLILLGVSAKSAEKNEAEFILDIQIQTEKQLAKQLEILEKRNNEARDEKAIDQAKFELEKQRLKIEETRFSLQEKEANQKKEQITGGLAVAPSILGASKAGQQALETARKQREEQVRKENFKTQDILIEQEAKRLNIGKQDVIRNIAQATAAGENPTLVEKFAAQQTSLTPNLIAAQRADRLGISSAESIAEAGKGLVTPKAGPMQTGIESFSKSIIAPEFKDIASAIRELIGRINSAPLVTSGSGGN